MSRHRNVRNLDLDDEMDDDYDDDDYDEEDDESYQHDYAYDREGAKTVQYLDPVAAPVENVQRAAVNLVDEVQNVVGPAFAREQISAALADAGHDVQTSINILLDQGPRAAPPPGLNAPAGLAAPPGLAPPPGLGKPPASIRKDQAQSVKRLPLVQREDDGLEFHTAVPVIIPVPPRPAPVVLRKDAAADDGSRAGNKSARKVVSGKTDERTNALSAVLIAGNGQGDVSDTSAKGDTQARSLVELTVVKTQSLAPASTNSTSAGDSSLVPGPGSSTPLVRPPSASPHALPHATHAHMSTTESSETGKSSFSVGAQQSLTISGSLMGASVQTGSQNLSGASLHPALTKRGGLSASSMDSSKGLSSLSSGQPGLPPSSLTGIGGALGQPTNVSAALPVSAGSATLGRTPNAIAGLSTGLAGLASRSTGPIPAKAVLSQELPGTKMLGSSLAGSLAVPASPLGQQGLAGLSGTLSGLTVPSSSLHGMSLKGLGAPLSSRDAPAGTSGSTLAWGGGPLSLAQLAGASSSNSTASLANFGAPTINQLASQDAGFMSGSDAIKSALAALGNSTSLNPSASSLAFMPMKPPGLALGTGVKQKLHPASPKADGAPRLPQAADHTSSQPPKSIEQSSFSLFPESPLVKSDIMEIPLLAEPSTFAQFFTTAAPSPVPSLANLRILPLSAPTAGVIDDDHERVQPFKFDSPSPDDIVSKARQQVSQAKSHSTKTILKPAATKSGPSTKTVPLSTAKSIDAPSAAIDQLEQDMNALGFKSTPSAQPPSSASNPAIARTASLSSVSSNPPAMSKTGSTASVGKNSPKMKRIDVLGEYKKRNAEKETLNLVVVGHVDAGKSTLMGHLLYLLGEVTDRSMKKFEREAEKMKKGSFAYAWVLDETEEERSRGVTIDVAITKFQTPHRKFTLLDAPGHRDFVPNMMSGASQADVAILVVDATNGEFETGFDSGGQTREHAVLIRSLGVNQLIVAVNKLDVVDWSKARFDEITAKLSTFLAQVGFRKSKVWFVPTSGFTGENLVKRAAPGLCAWYSGPTLVDQIDAFDPPTRSVDKPFRLSISDYFKGGLASGGGGGAVSVSGRIEGGTVQVGEMILVLPINETGIVKALEVAEDSVQWAVAGDNVTMSLTGVDITHINIGSVLCDPASPIPITSHFAAQIVTFDIDIPLTIGVPVVLHHQSLTEQATITKLTALLNRATNEVVKKNPRALPRNVTALVEIKTARPVCVDLFRTSKELGRFLLRSGMVTVAGGVVVNILSFEKGGASHDGAGL